MGHWAPAIPVFPHLNLWLCNGREATARLSNLRNLRTLLIRSSAVGSENLKKFSLNPVEGISTARHVQPVTLVEV